MDIVSMEALLRAQEEKLRGELQADDLIEKDRKRSVERLRGAFGELLLRYNAEYSGDRPRQAMADGLTASAGELFALLLAGTAKTEESSRQVRPGGVAALVAAVVCALAGVLLFEPYRLVSYALFAACGLGLFLAGRFWLTERTGRARAGLDADAVWKTLCRAGETMDRKLDAFSEQNRAWEAERDARRERSADGMDPEELQLLSDLLEALYSGSGEFSLRQLKKVRAYLQKRKVDIIEYDPSVSSVFELLPTKNETRTLRPALMAGEKLLLVGRAVEHTD